MDSIVRYSDNIARYNEKKAFFEEQSIEFLEKRKRQLRGIITRNQIELDIILNELNRRGRDSK